MALRSRLASVRDSTTLQLMKYLQEFSTLQKVPFGLILTLLVQGSLDVKDNDALRHYMATAEKLKDTAEVKELLAIIDRISAKNAITDLPFIVLDKSSGWGKTQMAFNLMAAGKNVHYVLGLIGSNPQPIYQCFFERSSLFLKCARKDFKKLKECIKKRRGARPGIVHIRYPRINPGNLFGYIWAVLHGTTFEGSKPRVDVMAEIALKKPEVLPIFFVDECAAEDEEEETIVALIRNVFRSLGLVVILSSTNSKATNILDDMAFKLSRWGGAVHWCTVVSRFPVFAYEHKEGHPAYLGDLCRHSRPWFALLAIEFFEKNPNGSIDEMAEFIFKEVIRDKVPYYGYQQFLFGQMSLFLAASCTKKTSRINYHFADLSPTENFDLIATQHNEILRNGINYHDSKRVTMPKLEDDILLYLCMSGGRNTEPLFPRRLESLKFRKAMDYIDWSSVYDSGLDQDQLSSDAMKLEAMSAGVLVRCSHTNGFRGISLEKLLCHVVYELEICEELPDRLVLVPEHLKGLMKQIVPFLPPPNQQFPEFANHFFEDVKLIGEIIRTPYSDRIELKLVIRTLEKHEVVLVITGECKDYGKPLHLQTVKAIFKRVPADSKVHLVFTNTLQEIQSQTDKKPTEQSADWKAFKKLSNADMLKLEGNRMCRINGLGKAVGEAESKKDNDKKLILFIPIDSQVSPVK